MGPARLGPDCFAALLFPDEPRFRVKTFSGRCRLRVAATPRVARGPRFTLGTATLDAASTWLDIDGADRAGRPFQTWVASARRAGARHRRPGPGQPARLAKGHGRTPAAAGHRGDQPGSRDRALLAAALATTPSRTSGSSTPDTKTIAWISRLDHREPARPRPTAGRLQGHPVCGYQSQAEVSGSCSPRRLGRAARASPAGRRPGRRGPARRGSTNHAPLYLDMAAALALQAVLAIHTLEANVSRAWSGTSTPNARTTCASAEYAVPVPRRSRGPWWTTGAWFAERAVRGRRPGSTSTCSTTTRWPAPGSAAPARPRALPHAPGRRRVIQQRSLAAAAVRAVLLRARWRGALTGLRDHAGEPGEWTADLGRHVAAPGAPGAGARAATSAGLPRRAAG